MDGWMDRQIDREREEREEREYLSFEVHVQVVIRGVIFRRRNNSDVCLGDTAGWLVDERGRGMSVGGSDNRVAVVEVVVMVVVWHVHMKNVDVRVPVGHDRILIVKVDFILLFWCIGGRKRWNEPVKRVIWSCQFVNLSAYQVEKYYLCLINLCYLSMYGSSALLHCSRLKAS